MTIRAVRESYTSTTDIEDLLRYFHVRTHVQHAYIHDRSSGHDHKQTLCLISVLTHIPARTHLVVQQCNCISTDARSGFLQSNCVLHQQPFASKFACSMQRHSTAHLAGCVAANADFSEFSNFKPMTLPFIWKRNPN